VKGEKGQMNLVLGEKVIYVKLLFQQQHQEKKCKKYRFPQAPASFKSRELISPKQQLQCHEAQHRPHITTTFTGARL